MVFMLQERRCNPTPGGRIATGEKYGRQPRSAHGKPFQSLILEVITYSNVSDSNNIELLYFNKKCVSVYVVKTLQQLRCDALFPALISFTLSVSICICACFF